MIVCNVSLQRSLIAPVVCVNDHLSVRVSTKMRQIWVMYCVYCTIESTTSKQAVHQSDLRVQALQRMRQKSEEVQEGSQAYLTKC